MGVMLRAASLCTVLALVAAQDPVQVLGSSLKGGSISLSPFDLRILTNQTHALWTISFPAQTSLQSIGWAGVGIGSSMQTMDAYVLWPNSTGGWAISHRTAAGHQMPTVPSGDSAANLVASGVQLVPNVPVNNSAGPTVSFLRPLTLSSTSYVTDKPSNENLTNSSATSLVYAFGANRPSSDAYDSTLTIHRENGLTAIDLTVPFVAASASASAALPTSTSVTLTVPSAPPASTVVAEEQTWTEYDRFVIAHATLGCVAWLLLVPFAILLARFGRNLSVWMSAHRGLQSVAAAMTIAAFGLGVEAVQQNDMAHFNDAHKIIGLLVFIFVLIQIALGFLSHALYDSARKRRPLQNLAHVVLGIFTPILAFVQIYLGFREYERLGGYSTPTAVVVVVSVLIGLTSLAYLIGLVLLARHLVGGTSKQSVSDTEEKADESPAKEVDAETGSKEDVPSGEL